MRSPLVTFFIVINIAIFFKWSLNPESLFMADNFLVSWQGLEEGRWWTLISSVFSHNLIWHIFINMYVLNSFGSFVERVLGSKTFFFFYIIAGIVASLTHSLVSAFLMNEPELPALGASGAIAGIVLIFSLLFPKEKILVFGIIPLPALWGALAFVAFDIWGLISQVSGQPSIVGHGAHLGGALTGIIYFLYLKVRVRRQRSTGFNL